MRKRKRRKLPTFPWLLDGHALSAHSTHTASSKCFWIPKESASNEQAEEEWGDSGATTTTTTKAAVAIKPPSINIGDTKTVEVVFTTNPQDFYVQVSDSSELFTLMDVIAAAYESVGPVNTESLQTGSACIARYAEDETWYRAVVETVSADSAMVFFCDYGNKENVPLTDIKEIKNEHLHLPAQGIPCSLLAAKPQDHSWSASEIDCFTGATEGKTLEARFVSQSSGRFNVILKDTESSSDINLQFGATPEQLQAKVFTPPVYDAFSAPAQTPQLIELDQRYSCQSFSPDTVEKVSITWFIDPEQFYCQLRSSQAVMNDMMTSIQEAYCSKPPTCRPFQLGLPVIAKFRGDNVLYRAEVKDIEDPVSVVVQYVDFGNCDNVLNSCVWDMEARFMDLPKQAVLCTLRGVKPTDEMWSQKDTMKFFEVEEFECTFHRFIEEKFEVSLVHSGLNVVSNLIEAGLAREEILEATSETVSDEEPVELDLLPGQILKVHVTFVECVSKFFVQLNVEFAQKIQAMVDQHAENPENLQPVDAEKLSVGELCLASPDSVQWYRAKIGDTAQTTGVFVTFIDFGDGDEVPVNKVMVSPAPLQNVPAQATECALHGLDITLSPEVEDKFKSDIEDKDVIIKVEAVETEKLLVSLYDMEGRKLEVLKDTAVEPLIECLCPLPVLSRRTRVWVSHVNNANSLWLQRVKDSEVLSELLDKIHNIYEEEGKGVETNATVGSLCAAKSESFGTWYRARIISLNSKGDTCDVLFIDYGNTESLPVATNIKALDASLFSPHELAVQISLPLSTSEDLATQLQEMTADKEFTAVFSERNNNIWFADLLDDNMSLSSKLVELGQATFLPGMEIENQITELKKELASELPVSLEVYVSHFDSPGQFWLQLASNSDAVMKFQDNIQIIAESLPALEAVEVGLRCIAQFSDDNLWYRAVVLDSNSSYITVRYTDYGNTSQVEVTAEGLKELPEELGSIPDFAFPCCINASPVDGSYWNAEAVARCEELINQEATITVNIVGEEEEVKIVDVFVDGIAIVDVLLKETLAVPRKPPVVECSVDTVQEVHTSSNVEHTDPQQPEETVELSISVFDTEVCEQELEIAAENSVFDEVGEQCESNTEDNLAVVCHAESLEEFWLQYQSKADQVHQLEYRLLEAESFPILNDVTEGKLCAAIFDDCQWYRAKVLDKTDQGIRVQFIDYGNISVCEDLRKLPADLASLPPMAQRCRLALPKTITEWPSSAKEKFLDLVGDGCKLLEVQIIEKGDPVTVSLAFDGQQICQDLLEVSVSTADPTKFEQSEDQEESVEKEGYQEDITEVPEYSEDMVEVPEVTETVVTDDLQNTEKLNSDCNDNCGNDTLNKADVTTVTHVISDSQSKNEDAYDEHLSDLNRSTCHDSKEDETEFSGVNDIKCSVELTLAKESVMDKNDTETRKHDISAAEAEQYIGANDGIAPAEGSEMDATSAHCNRKTDEKPKSTEELPEHGANVSNTAEYPEEEPSAEKIVCVDGLVSNLNESVSVGEDGKEPETETSDVNGLKDVSELPTVEETLIDESYTEMEKLNISAAGKQYSDANDGTVPVEDSDLPEVSACSNPVPDMKPKSTEESPAHEVNASNTPDYPKRDGHAEKLEDDHNESLGNVKSSECKTQHTEELVRKINVEMMVMGKAEKMSQIDRLISTTGIKGLTSASSSLPQCDETGPISLPEELLMPQIENGETKSEPCTPLLPHTGRSSVKDENEKQEKSFSSPRLNHNERIVPGCISRGESLDSLNETLSVTVIHDSEEIVPDTV